MSRRRKASLAGLGALGWLVEVFEVTDDETGLSMVLHAVGSGLTELDGIAQLRDGLLWGDRVRLRE